MDVIFDLSTAIQQVFRRFRRAVSIARVNTENLSLLKYNDMK